MRVAALDCGTNSLRLLVADIDSDGRLHDLTRQMRIVRLGQGVDRSGRLAAEALERTGAALAEYAGTIAAADVDRIRMVATSAVRDAANHDEFTALVERSIGVIPDIVTGDEEARLAFTGAVSVPEVAAYPQVLLTDIGGGSTELILGRSVPPTVIAATSMDVGSVRLTERHFVTELGPTDPPAAEQIAAATADVNAALDGAGAVVPLDSGALLVGVAGTVTTLAGIALGLTGYDSARIHGARISATDMEATIAALLKMARPERSAIPVLHPGRVDVIAAGAVVVRTIMRRVGADSLVVSEHDILDGIALSMAPPRTSSEEAG